MSRRIEVLFTFKVLGSQRLKRKTTEYRAVRDSFGFRMDRKGESAKQFKAFMWCGTYDSLVGHYDAVRNHFGENYVTQIAPLELPARAIG